MAKKRFLLTINCKDEKQQNDYKLFCDSIGKSQSALHWEMFEKYRRDQVISEEEKLDAIASQVDSTQRAYSKGMEKKLENLTYEIIKLEILLANFIDRAEASPYVDAKKSVTDMLELGKAPENHIERECGPDEDKLIAGYEEDYIDHAKNGGARLLNLSGRIADMIATGELTLNNSIEENDEEFYQQNKKED